MLQLIYAPNEIFKKKALEVQNIDDEIKQNIKDMFKVLQIEQGIGLGANMVGLLKRIVVIRMHQQDKIHEFAMINPKIIESSKETQIFEEASLSFPGITAKIVRPKNIKVEFQDQDGQKQNLEASDFLSTVIQHEIDYLDGKIFLDYISKLKRDMLIKKMLKHMKAHPPHFHTSSCNH